MDPRRESIKRRLVLDIDDAVDATPTPADLDWMLEVIEDAIRMQFDMKIIKASLTKIDL